MAGQTRTRPACPDRRAPDAAAEKDFALVQELVGAIRQIRAEYGVEPGKSVNVRVGRTHAAFSAEEGTMRRLAKVAEMSYGAPPSAPGAHAVLADGTEVYIALGTRRDPQKESGPARRREGAPGAAAGGAARQAGQRELREPGPRR